MSLITNNSISLIIIAFFILFTFVGFLRKPLTALMFFFVMYDVVPKFVSLNTVVTLVIAGVATLIFAILSIKSRKISALLFGFTLTYLTFYQLATTVDAVMSIAKQKDIDFLNKVLSGTLVGALNKTTLKLAASGAVGIICFLFSKKMVEFIGGLFGGFMIVTYLLDVVEGGTVAKFPLTTFYKDILGVVNDFISKNMQVYKITLGDTGELNVVIALAAALIIAIIVSIVKRNKYEFLLETNC